MISMCLYVFLFYVRTLQTWKWFGPTVVDAYPIAARMRRIGLLDNMTMEHLRWISYATLLLIVFVYLFMIWLSSSIRNESCISALRTRYILWVIGPYIMLGIICLLFYPHVSRPMDTVDYTMHVRILFIHKANPYEQAAISYAAQDSLVRFMEAKKRPCVYGPIWLFLSVFPGLIGMGQLVPSIIAFKLMFFAGGLICLWLIWIFYTKATGQDHLLTSGVLVAWNPILHLISHGAGHNDIMMAVFAAGMIVALAFRRSTGAFISWILSILVKYLTAPLVVPLMLACWTLEHRRSTTDKLKSIGGGLIISGILAGFAILPFGIENVIGNASSRYGGQLSLDSTSKISVLVSLITKILRFVDCNLPPTRLASIIGLVLPLLWIIYTLYRSLRVRDIESFVKVAVESLLFYITFVSLPVYGQYAVTALILAGFLQKSKWHYVATLVVSIALAWDSLFLVYIPVTYPKWEGLLHQFSHVLVIGVLGIYIILKWIHSA